MNETEPRKNVSVEGANITGDVFGGGNKAKVWGNAHVNIGKDWEVLELWGLDILHLRHCET